MGITLVSLTDTIATATSFAARRGDEVDPDHEMVGIGTSNIAAGFFQGFAVSLRGSRAAVADQSGARTQLTGLAGAGLVAVRHGLNTTLDREHFYPSLDQALDAINNAAGDSPMPPDEGMPPP